MSDEQINIAIAELTGLAVIHDPAGPKDCPEAWKTGFFTPKAAKQRRISWPSSAVIKVVPDYCNDLNAMHEAENKLTPFQRIKHGHFLQEILNEAVVGFVSNYESELKSLSRVASATAAQRAEAFLRTLGKWEEA